MACPLSMHCSQAANPPWLRRHARRRSATDGALHRQPRLQRDVRGYVSSQRGRAARGRGHRRRRQRRPLGRQRRVGHGQRRLHPVQRRNRSNSNHTHTHLHRSQTACFLSLRSRSSFFLFCLSRRLRSSALALAYASARFFMMVSRLFWNLRSACSNDSSRAQWVRLRRSRYSADAHVLRSFASLADRTSELSASITNLAFSLALAFHFGLALVVFCLRIRDSNADLDSVLNHCFCRSEAACLYSGWFLASFMRIVMASDHLYGTSPSSPST